MALHQPQHILFVESDADAHGVTTAMLEHLGYTVRAEKEGLKALQAFSEEPDRFDLALFGDRMGEITGLELALRFKRIRPNLPIVFYVGYLDKPSAERVRTRIAEGVLLKPATLREVADALREAFHQPTRRKADR